MKPSASLHMDMSYTHVQTYLSFLLNNLPLKIEMQVKTKYLKKKKEKKVRKEKNVFMFNCSIFSATALCHHHNHT